MLHETQTVPTATRSTLSNLFNVVDAFDVLPSSYVKTFLAISSDEGHSLRHYAKVCSCSMAAMSKRVLDLGDSMSADKTRPGAGLLEGREDVTDRRFLTVRLSPKGRAMAQRIASMVRS